MIPKNDQKKRLKTRLKHEIEEDIEEYFSDIGPLTNSIQDSEDYHLDVENGILVSDTNPVIKEVGS